MFVLVVRAKEHQVSKTDIPLTAFIEAACVPLDSDHASGTLDRAESIVAIRIVSSCR